MMPRGTLNARTDRNTRLENGKVEREIVDVSGVNLWRQPISRLGVARRTLLRFDGELAEGFGSLTATTYLSWAFWNDNYTSTPYCSSSTIYGFPTAWWTDSLYRFCTLSYLAPSPSSSSREMKRHEAHEEACWFDQVRDS